jgi:hypothetical protein
LILRTIESGRPNQRSVILRPQFIHRGSCGCALTTGLPTQIG